MAMVKLILLFILLPVLLVSSSSNKSLAISNYESKNSLEVAVSTPQVLRGPLIDLSTWTPGGTVLPADHMRFEKAFFAKPDGTVFLSDKSSVLWEFTTGSPFLKSEQSRPDLDYFVNFDENGQLQEYTKDFGYRALKLNIQEYVRGAAILQDFHMISVSKKTTVYYLNASSGEVINTHRLHTNESNKEVSVTENKLYPPRLENTDEYIMLVVADDLLTSTVLPMDPTQSSTEISKPVWQCSRSYVTAVYVQNGRPQLTIPDYSSNLSTTRPFMLSPKCVQNGRSQITIPVYLLLPPSHKALMRPPVDHPYHLESHEQEHLKLSSAHGFLNILILSTLIIIMGRIIFLYCKFKMVADNHNQISLKVKQPTTRKKKGRKNVNTKRGAPVPSLSESKKYEHDGYGMQPVKSKAILVNTDEGRWVGKLFVSNSEIGRGGNGTIVLEGIYKGHPVAVKRLLRAHHEVANKEVEILFASDRHPNVVRWYGVKEDMDFVYISLERCLCNLSDLVWLFSESSLQQSDSENQTSVDEDRRPLFYGKGFNKDIELWSVDGFPSLQLLNLMRNVVAGLAHLHKLGIIHRDMKPQNVLISTDKDLTAKLSDMGISKRLVGDMTSVSYNATVCGTSGWQAPEQLHGRYKRYTRAVDLFSLGCILFFCITKGRHPFGRHFERDSNIVNNRIDLFLVEHIPEAVDLLLQLLSPDPNLRLSATQVLHHPLFWNSEMRLAFLRDTSDRVELEDRENESELLKALESVALTAFGGKWGDKMDAAVLNDIGRYRKYKFDSLRDLLRVVRNKLNHFRELQKEVQEILGPVPEGFDKYFASRFPKLLIEVYKVMSIHCSNEDSFKKYFKGNTI